MSFYRGNFTYALARIVTNHQLYGALHGPSWRDINEYLVTWVLVSGIVVKASWRPKYPYEGLDELCVRTSVVFSVPGKQRDGNTLGDYMEEERFHLICPHVRIQRFPEVYLDPEDPKCPAPRYIS
jgi:hypothetical protein